jgi:hypothetical protein
VLLTPALRLMTRIMAQHAIRKNMANLAGMAETTAQRPADGAQR